MGKKGKSPKRPVKWKQTRAHFRLEYNSIQLRKKGQKPFPIGIFIYSHTPQLPDGQSHVFFILPSIPLPHNGEKPVTLLDRPPRRARRSHLRRRRRARLLEALRHYNPRLRVHSAPSMVHSRLSLLSARFQPSRFGLARHNQSTLPFLSHSCFVFLRRFGFYCMSIKSCCL